MNLLTRDLGNLALSNTMRWLDAPPNMAGDVRLHVALKCEKNAKPHQALVAFLFNHTLTKDQLNEIGISLSPSVGPYVYLTTAPGLAESDLALHLPLGVRVLKIGLRTWDTQKPIVAVSLRVDRDGDDSNRYYIIKADDFRLTTGIEKFLRLFKLCEEFGIPVSVGAIGRALRHGRYEDRKLIEDLCNKGAIELWNHSLNHKVMQDMTEVQVEQEIAAATTACLRELNVKPVGFGAPFNKCNEMMAETAARLGLPYTYESLFPKESFFTPEHNASLGKQPNFDIFMEGIKTRGLMEVVVIQIHPPRWTSRGFDEFRKILTWLRDNKYVAITPSEIIASTPGKEKNKTSVVGLHACMVARLTDFWKERATEYCKTLANFSSYFINRFALNSPYLHDFLKELGADIGSRIVVDVGAGLAQWSLPFLSFDDDCNVHAFDINKTIVRAVRDAQERGLLSDRFHLHDEDYTKTQALRQGSVSYLTCANAINYIPLLAFAEKTRYLFHEGALALIHFQTGHFNLTGYRRSLANGDFPAAKERALSEIRQQLVRRGFSALQPGRATHTIDEMEAVFYAHCLRLHDTYNPIFESLENGQPTFQGVIFKKDGSIDVKKLSDKFRIELRQKLCRAGFPAFDESLFAEYERDMEDKDLFLLKTRGMGSTFKGAQPLPFETDLADTLASKAFERAAQMLQDSPTTDDTHLLAGFALAVLLDKADRRRHFVARLHNLKTKDSLHRLCFSLHELLEGNPDKAHAIQFSQTGAMLDE